MDEIKAKAYLLALPEAQEDYPFGPDVAVYKVRDKMFATLSSEKGVARMNLKCDPERALMLRDVFEAVIPGYHMNKKHWNTVILDGSIPTAEVEGMIDHSYALVVQGLKKAERDRLLLVHGEDEVYRGAL